MLPDDHEKPASVGEPPRILLVPMFVAVDLLRPVVDVRGWEDMRYNNLARELVQGLLKRARPTYAPQVRGLAERIGLLT